MKTKEEEQMLWHFEGNFFYNCAAYMKEDYIDLDLKIDSIEKGELKEINELKNFKYFNLMVI